MKKKEIDNQYEPPKFVRANETMPYVIVRTRSAGVFAGYLEEKNGNKATLRESRRIWYWSGAATLSELAVNGTRKPDECKFPVPVPKQYLTEVIEILFATEKAQESIERVKIWSA